MRVPGLLRWRPRSRSSVAGFVVLALVCGTLVFYAVAAEGFTRHRADLNDGGIWVTGGSSAPALGRVNKPIDQLDGYLPVDSANLDVVQNGLAVVGVDRSNAQLLAVDPTTVSAPRSARAELSSTSNVGVGGGTLAVVDSRSGRVWATSADPTQAVTDLSQVDRSAKALAKIGAGAAVAVTDGGTVLAYSSEHRRLATIRPSSGGYARPEYQKVSGAFGADVQLAAVGERAVLLDKRTGKLTVVGGKSAELPSDSVLQQSGPDESEVYVATPTSLLAIGLENGKTRRVDDVQNAAAARPARVGTCTFGAWAGQDGRTVVACDGQKAYQHDLGAPLTSPVFRVNRGQVLLNDLATGLAWNVDREPIMVTRWQDYKLSQQQKTNKDKDKNPQRNQDRRRPRAVKDDLGARGGALTILHVLDNDSSVDGRTLVIDSVTPVTGVQRATATIAPDRQTIQFQSPNAASGVASFDYVINDGSKKSEKARVSVAMHDAGEASTPAPRPKFTWPTYHVPADGLVEVPVLGDWRDKQAGDPLTLVGRPEVDEGSVDVASNGRIRFTAPHKGGVQVVRYQVAGSNGTPGKGQISFAVQRPDDTQSFSALAQPDVVSGTIGKPIVFEPLANDLPGSDPLTPDAQLKIVADVAGAPGEAVTDKQNGRVTITPRTAGVHWLTYEAGYGNANPAKSSIRVDVAKAASTRPVAVPDVLTLHGQQSALVDVLANDIDPTGKLLTVTSAQPAIGGADSQMELAVVKGRWLRVRASTAKLSPATQTLKYTISNGAESADGVVSVVWRPAEADAQPVTQSDEATVRAGSSVAVPVLDNDFSPNGEQLSLSTNFDGHPAGELETYPKLGRAYVSGGLVRYVAPRALKDAQVVTVNYVARDLTGSLSPVTPIRVTVLPPPSAKRPNQDPQPLAIEGRAVAGDTVKIKLPAGVADPDGDPVTITGVSTAPRLGRLVRTNADSFFYEAFPGQSGTDTFKYRVADPYGGVGEGAVRVAVVAPGQPQPPLALPDSLVVAPGRVVTLDVLANDLVAAGDRVRVKLYSAPKSARLVSDTGPLTVPGPKDPAKPLKIAYQIENGLGVPSRTTVTIMAQPGFNNPPVVFDGFGKYDDKADATLDVLATAYDPDSADGDLKVEALPPESVEATAAGGKITVKRTNESLVVPFRVTDGDGGSATAVFYVPPTKAGPPYLAPDKVARVAPGKSVKVSLKDVVVDPAGRAVKLGVTSQILGSPDGKVTVKATSADELQITAASDYEGPGSASFPVYDGKEINDPAGQQAYLNLPVVVGDAEQILTCPDDPIRLREGGDIVALDIASLCHVWVPDTGSKQGLEFSGRWIKAPGEVTIGKPGRDVRLTPGSNAKADSTGVLEVRATGSRSKPGRLNIQVVPSPRPVLGDLRRELRSGTSQTIDITPFVTSTVREPEIKVTSVGQADGVKVTSSGSEVTVDVGKTHGVKVIPIEFTDAPKSSSPYRTGTGQITLTVQDAPDRPAAPVPAPGIRSGVVQLSWPVPAANGAPITEYEVDYGSGKQACPAPRCLITGLTNGKTYTFRLRARNAVNWSEWSPQSVGVKPDEKAGPVSGIHLTSIGDGSLGLAWTPPKNQTSRLTGYTITWPGGSRTSTSPAVTVGPLRNSQTYAFTITAANESYPVGEAATSAPFQSAGVPRVVQNLESDFDELGGGQPSVTISWSALGAEGTNGPAGTLSYTVKDGNAVICNRTTATSCTKTTSWGTQHTYSVIAQTTDSLGGEHVGPPATVTTDVSGKADAPTGVSLRATGPTSSLVLDWASANPRGVTPRVECQYVSGGSGSCGRLAPTGPATLNGLSNGTPYSVKLRQCNQSATSCSGWVTSGSATPYGQINGVQISAGVTGACYNWSASGDANGKSASAVVQMDGATVWSTTTAGAFSKSGRKCVDFGRGHTWKVVVTDSSPSTRPTAEDSTGPSTAATGNSKFYDGGDAGSPNSPCVTNCRWLNVRLSNWSGTGWCPVQNVGTNGNRTYWYQTGRADANGDWAGTLTTSGGTKLVSNQSLITEDADSCRPTPGGATR